MRVRLVIVLCGALAAAILALTVFHDIFDELQQAEDAALRRTQSTSRILEEHAARAFGETALVLREVRRMLASHPEFDQPGSAAIRGMLRDRLEGPTVISNLVVTRADGKVIHDARNPGGNSEAPDRPTAAPSARSTRGVERPAIALPMRPAGQGAISLPLSLAVTDSGGRTVGIVTAMIPLSYFDAIYASIQGDQHGVITLWRRDGGVLFRHPVDDFEIGRIVLWNRLFDQELTRAEAGTFREPAAGGGTRVVSWRAVAGWPLVISVSAVDTDYLAEWRENAWLIGAGAGIGVLIILVLAALLARHVEQLGQAQADTASARRRLADAIDSLPDAFILFDRDDRLVTVNQKYREYFHKVAHLLVPGTTYEQILRLALERGAYPAAIGREEEWLARRLRSHRQPGPPFEQALADGRWFRISEHRTEDGGIVGVRVDITERKRIEGSLRDNERQAQAIMDATVNGLVVIDEAGTIERINRSVAAMFGYSSDELIGHNVNVLMAEPFRSKHDLYLARYRETNEPKIVGGGGVEGVGRRKDRSTFPIDLVIGELTLDGRRRFIGAMRDISDRVNVQAMLREAIESTSDGFVYFDPDGRLVVCNQRYIEAYSYLKEVPRIEGITFEEIVRRGLEKNYVADPLARSDPEAWVRLRMAQHRSPPETPVLRQLTDGRWLMINDRRTPSGGLVGVRTDVTEHIRTAEALRDSERRFRLLMDGARDYAILMLDPDGNVTSWNEGARQITGYETVDIIGRSRETLRPPRRIGAGASADALRIARETGRYAGRVQRMRKDGSLFWADVVISRIDDDNGVLSGFAKVMHDVTERIAIEEQLAQAQKMEAVGQLTGGLAHDFNNLLQVVMSNLEFLLDRPGGDVEAVARTGEALRAAERGAELTAQMLAFGRRQTLTPRRTDLRALIEELTGLLRHTLGESIAIDLRLADTLRWVMIDRGQLETALVNVALNARDAMPRGGRLRIVADNVELGDSYVRQHPEARRGRYVGITITDTGQGMTEAVRAHAFEPFFTTKEVGKGSGLGLSMVYGFVKQSGGHVQLESAPGRGTTVTLYLPEAADQAAVNGGVTAFPVVRGRDETVLVVEDNHDVRQLAVSMLEGLGYKVLEAADGPAALSLLDAAQGVELLLTDVMLPGGMSGPDIAREARRRRPGLKLAHMSGYAGSGGGNIVLDPEVTFIGKPFTRAAFARGIRTALDA